MTSPLRHEVRDGVAWITIDRPEVRNALDESTFVDLTALVAGLGRDDAVRCLVIRGGGDRVFVSGGDIREFREKLATPDDAIAYDVMAELLNVAVGSVPQPVIAMLNGHAIGSGCLLAIACDFRIASDRARMGIPVATIGFCIGPPDLVRLSRLVGTARAKLMLMTGELVNAAEALAHGLVDTVVPPDALEAETVALARRLAANAPLSLKATKEMAARFAASLPGVEDGTRWYREAYGSRDLREGIDALLGKRAPAFTGR